MCYTITAPAALRFIPSGGFGSLSDCVFGDGRTEKFSLYLPSHSHHQETLPPGTRERAHAIRPIGARHCNKMSIEYYNCDRCCCDRKRQKVLDGKKNARTDEIWSERLYVGLCAISGAIFNAHSIRLATTCHVHMAHFRSTPVHMQFQISININRIYSRSRSSSSRPSSVPNTSRFRSLSDALASVYVHKYSTTLGTQGSLPGAVGVSANNLLSTY